MTRRCGKEEDLSELLQRLDYEAEGPSTAADNFWEPQLEPKHKIFLSHSGVQKDFTEQLCVDLERCQYYPFFDKRPDSLPKGRKFPELIFQAAQQCHVAVLILSEEFFTCTKWPMLELEAFVHAQKTNREKIAILPVYLGISRDECTKNGARRSYWFSVWRKWAEVDDRIDAHKWEEALKVLGPSNGIEYVRSLGEVTLRKEIVRVVQGLVRPVSTWSVGEIHGRTRICKAIIEKLMSTKPSLVYGVRVVGIYGMGGVGKTSFCKVLCDELYTKFQGKVCHGELGIKSPCELQKQVQRELTDINHNTLTSSLSEDMTTNLLRQRVRQQRVFFALDNVWQESIEEAKVYLRAGFHNGSMVMVTARSIDLLDRMNIDRDNCMEMPELEEEDAKHLFLYHAAFGVQFKSKDEEDNIQYCVRQCKFRKGGNVGEHFHPLALKVLGAQVGSLGVDPKIWVENLSKKDKFNQFGEKVHPIFNVLRRGYDSLLGEDKLLFMDAILFHPLYEQSYYGDGNILQVDIYKWLSIVHQTEVMAIKNRLQGLKAKSLIEDIGDNFRGVSVHDLYLEFAKLEVKRGDVDMRRWVWYNGSVSYPKDLAKTPSGYCWQNVERVSLKYNEDPSNIHIQWRGTLEEFKWQHFSNVVVVQLLININEVLDLRGLRCLRSLDIKWGGYGYRQNVGDGKLIGLGELRNLGWLDLCNIYYAPCLEEISCLTSLEVLRLDLNCGKNCRRELLPPPNLDKCIHLQELVFEQCGCLKAFPDLSMLRSLRKVYFQRCNIAEELVGLSSQMCALQELWLVNCASLCHIAGLGDLVSLQVLGIEECNKLQQLLDICKLTNLQQLIISDIKHVQGFSESMLMQDLEVSRVEELPNLHLLRNLRRLSLDSFSGSMLPRFGNFNALEELNFMGLNEVRELSDMHNLSRLRKFSIWNAPKLVLKLPMLGDLVALEYLWLLECGTLVGIAEVPDLYKLTTLQVLRVGNTPIRSLPSLKPLTQLRVLDCSNTELAELPDLTGSKLLERIDLCGCHELTSLGNLANLPALEMLEVDGCYRLEKLPDLRTCKRLRFLALCHSGVRLSSEDIMVLAALKVSKVFVCDHFQLNFSTMLESMSLTEVVTKIEAKQLEYFATPQTMDPRWDFCMHHRDR